MVDVARAFGPGSDQGTTRAKPAIWTNKADFTEKQQALQDAAGDLLNAARSGDRKGIGCARPVPTRPAVFPTSMDRTSCRLLTRSW